MVLRSACKKRESSATEKHDLPAYFGDSFQFVGRKQGGKFLQRNSRICRRRFVQREEVRPQAAALKKAVLNYSLRYFLDLAQKLQ
jgi:hypothetical protein